MTHPLAPTLAPEQVAELLASPASAPAQAGHAPARPENVLGALERIEGTTTRHI